VPEIFGGSADLAGSNLTFVKGSKGVTRSEGGNYCYYGVREFAMTAIANGIALHGGLIPYTATFLVFRLRPQRHPHGGADEAAPDHGSPMTPSASARTARRTSRSSTPSLRIIPNVDVWRPADATETAIAWTAAVERRRPEHPRPVAPEPADRDAKRRRCRHRQGRLHPVRCR
jgi:transketolase